MARILAAAGLDDVDQLIDSIPGDRRPPVNDADVKPYLLRVADRRSAPQPGPIPPVAERYTAGPAESTLPGIAAADLVLSNTGRHLHA